METGNATVAGQRGFEQEAAGNIKQSYHMTVTVSLAYKPQNMKTRSHKHTSKNIHSDITITKK